MDGERQRALAIWLVLVVPFVLFAGFLSARGTLTLRFVGVYWLTPAIVASIGVIPPPWG